MVEASGAALDLVVTADADEVRALRAGTCDGDDGDGGISVCCHTPPDEALGNWKTECCCSCAWVACHMVADVGWYTPGLDEGCCIKAGYVVTW